jgi:nicotinate-nucleotide adenylyltransferase
LIGRLGVFGGTFDPIHLAHLVLAEQAREQLRLDQVLFMPAFIPPHKMGRTLSPPKVRLEMAELAVAGHPNFEVGDLELRRTGPSYTVDTLRTLREQHPSAELFLLLGGDSLADFPTWREPREILSLAKLGVMKREGSPPPEQPTGWEAELAERVTFIEAPLLAISGTDLRRRVSEGRSIRYFVPAAVEAFINANKLYQGE